MQIQLERVYIQELKPCELCKWQRLPYFLIGVTVPLLSALKLNKILKNFVLFSFSVSLFLSLYHFLIQLGLIAGTCTVPQNVNTLEAFHSLLEHNENTCSLITWKVLGIPVTFYNFIFSLFFIFLLGIEKISSSISKCILIKHNI